jgi:hypothetical protein
MAGPRLLNEVRRVMRRLHYAIHTERSYCDWIARYVRFSSDAVARGAGKCRRPGFGGVSDAPLQEKIRVTI